ncbi:hypothetical protein N658DRAFT_94550 [Parathielavia hyrcaniae]|uniref:Uncharacterized protein n=1 Tax=Parathielavia hyrcaniae TaxID=113614 RepID=A0AAN6PZM5_9PEZI|nr:hypothetical protein N658DRAFT_94550 [Parathielavia hyrcaniae]
MERRSWAQKVNSTRHLPPAMDEASRVSRTAGTTAITAIASLAVCLLSGTPVPSLQPRASVRTLMKPANKQLIGGQLFVPRGCRPLHLTFIKYHVGRYPYSTAATRSVG